MRCSIPVQITFTHLESSSPTPVSHRLMRGEYPTGESRIVWRPEKYTQRISFVFHGRTLGEDVLIMWSEDSFHPGRSTTTRTLVLSHISSRWKNTLTGNLPTAMILLPRSAVFFANSGNRMRWALRWKLAFPSRAYNLAVFFGTPYIPKALVKREAVHAQTKDPRFPS